MPTIFTNSNNFPILPNETLLETLERMGYTVEYQCRSGYCGACRLKVHSGSVVYRETPMVFLLPDEILPCCCEVKEDIHIDITASLDESETLTGSLFEQE